MTSGCNVLDDASAKLVGTGAEFVILYDVSNPRTPVQKQTLRPLNTGSVKNLGRYAASWIGWWPKRPSSSAALT